MNRAAPVLVALCLAAVCATAAPAAGTANDPLRLAPQRSDFPATLSRYSSKRWPSIEQSLAAAGFKAKAADYAAEISRGSADTLYVSGRVIVLPNPAAARRLFLQYKTQDPAVAAKVAKPVQLRKYGDEQSAFTDTWNRADLRVRTGSVVWRVEIKYGGIEKKLTRAQALAELETYAAKLKVRVGRG